MGFIGPLASSGILFKTREKISGLIAGLENRGNKAHIIIS